MPAERATRRPLGRAVVEMYYRLREREQTPRRVALSVALGTLIGCQPLYGLHLALCFGLAKLLRLSGPIAYLAAHVNNPWSAPFLIYLEATIGRRLMRGSWLGFDPRTLRDAGALELGTDLLVGSAVVGVVLGSVLGVVAFLVSLRWRSSPVRAELVNRAARRYQELGLGTWERVRAKLRYDPVYLCLLSSIPFAERARVVDLGCGRGIFLAAIGAAQELAARDRWPGEWPTPPAAIDLTGIEVDEDAAHTARTALGDAATLLTGDLATVAVPDCDVVALIDVLHYLDRDTQSDLIERAARALAAGGLLIVRDADADGGLRFLLTRMQERVSSWARLELARPFHYRSAREWAELFEGHGFAAEVRPMAAGTPFANVLILARRTSPQA